MTCSSEWVKSELVREKCTTDELLVEADIANFKEKMEREISKNVQLEAENQKLQRQVCHSHYIFFDNKKLRIVVGIRTARTA